jgi:hypothetical protein
MRRAAPRRAPGHALFAATGARHGYGGVTTSCRNACGVAPYDSHVGATEQLAALARVHELLEQNGIDYWLFGGWAVDFYAGELTRAHDDVDIAVWLQDHGRIVELLEADGWNHAPYEDEDGGTGYERGGVRLELTFLVRGEDGGVSIPLRAGLVRWSAVVPERTVVELDGVRACVLPLQTLREGKSMPRDDAADAAKDRADFERLAGLT